MLIFPQMLVSACNQANIKVPDDLDNYDADKYPHWHFMVLTQLCRPCEPGEHFENAKIIATLKKKDMNKMSFEDCVQMGIIRKF